MMRAMLTEALDRRQYEAAALRLAIGAARMVNATPPEDRLELRAELELRANQRVLPLAMA